MRKIFHTEQDLLSTDLLCQYGIHREGFDEDNLTIGVKQRDSEDIPIIIGCSITSYSCQSICSFLEWKIVLPSEVI